MCDFLKYKAQYDINYDKNKIVLNFNELIYLFAKSYPKSCWMCTVIGLR